MTAPADFLSPGSQFPPAPHGSTSTVRSDATPAQPLPTCANCGSNLIAPAPSPARDEVREAAERLRNKMRATYADPRYMNVWATAQERLGPYTGPDWTEEAKALDAALDARPGGERGE